MTSICALQVQVLLERLQQPGLGLLPQTCGQPELPCLQHLLQISRSVQQLWVLCQVPV